MNTKLLILLLIAVTIVTLSLPSLADRLFVSAKAEPEVRTVRVAASTHAVEPESFAYKLELKRVVGKAFFVAGNNFELTAPGEVSYGFYRTEIDGMIELNVADGVKVLLYPDAEAKIVPTRSSIDVVDFHLLKGDAEFVTTSKNGRSFRVLSDGVCVNPESAVFRVRFNREKSSGNIVVKNGHLRVTSDIDSSRYFSLSAFFGLDFLDGDLQVPQRASIKSYDWKLSL